MSNFVCEHCGKENTERSDKYSEYYECNNGHRYPLNAELPTIGVSIMTDEAEPICPQCLSEYRRRKTFDRNLLPPPPMRKYRILTRKIGQ